MSVIDNIMLTALGGFLGTIVRASVSSVLNGRFPSALPYGTLTVNLGGSLCLGMLWAQFQAGAVYALAGIGFLGALTTFSTLMLELERLRDQRRYTALGRYLLISWLGGLLLAAFGYYISLELL